MIEFVESARIEDGVCRLADGTEVSPMDVRIIDLDTGKRPVDALGRLYGCVSVTPREIEAYFNDRQGDAHTWATETISGRYAVAVYRRKPEPRTTETPFTAAVWRERAEAAEARLARLETLEADLKQAQASLQQTTALLTEQCDVNDEIDTKRADLTVAFARLAVKAGLPVQVSANGAFAIRVSVDLPTGPVDFHVDNDFADLLAGLPFGLRDDDVPSADVQALRLTQAFNSTFDQTLIPEPATPDRVLAALEPLGSETVSGKRSFRQHLTERLT